MITPAYAIERAKIGMHNRDKSGAWAYFVPLNKHTALKYYTSAYQCNLTYDRQQLASENGFGPRLLSNIFEFFTPSSQPRWGYITQRATVAWDRFLPVYCGKLGITPFQYHNENGHFNSNLWHSIEYTMFEHDINWLNSMCQTHFPNYTDYDIHMVNFGYVKRKPVLIDFSHFNDFVYGVDKL